MDELLIKNNIVESEEDFVNSVLNLSVYDYFKKSTETFDDLVALSFYGIKFTYKKFNEKIDENVKALYASGIKKGDVIIVSLPSIPEALYLFYAINKIGAIYCGLDCRSTEEDVLKTISDVNPKICFVSDFHLHAFKNVNSCQVICVRSTNTIGGITKIGGFFADIFKGRTVIKMKNKNIFHFNEFVKRNNGCSDVILDRIDGDDICAYFYTSGTTYGRKCVILTNKNINAGVMQLAKAEIDINKGDSLLNIMPPFTCYGITIGTQLPLCLGVHARLYPLFNEKQMKKILLKEKPNFIITVPSHWETFLDDDFENCDLSFLKAIVVGGDKLFAEYENKINATLKECGSTSWLINGYGLTETASTAIIPPVGSPQGSMGKAAFLTEIKIFDNEKLCEVPVGEKGEICICSPSVCKGYLNDKPATDALLKVHDDGKIWLHSGDIAYEDENGFIYFCERIKRMYVRYDGTKVSPYAIEKVIEKCPEVKQCMIVTKDDENHAYGKVPVGIIVLKDTNNLARSKKDVQDFVNKYLAEYMRPVELIYVEHLPKTINGKLDYFLKDFEKISM